MHRGVAFADDWVREVWIIAPNRGSLTAARRYCRHLFSCGARQLRWHVALPVDPRHEAVWARYGALPIALSRNILTVALDDPALPPANTSAWPRIMHLSGGVTMGAARFGELAQIAAWGQEPRYYGPLGYSRGPTYDEVVRSVLPENPLFHAQTRTHLYTVRQKGQPVGVVFERHRDYAGDTIREIDMVLADETLPMRVWAEAGAAIVDVCFRRGTTRMVVNVREDLAGMAGIFGGVPATQWIAKGPSTRTHYSTTASQFYASIAARRFLRHAAR
jgi:hypothetical protein